MTWVNWVACDRHATLLSAPHTHARLDAQKTHLVTLQLHVEVSWSRGATKSSIFIGFYHYKPSSYWGTTILGNIHIAGSGHRHRRRDHHRHRRRHFEEASAEALPPRFGNTFDLQWYLRCIYLLPMYRCIYISIYLYIYLYIYLSIVLSFFLYLYVRSDGN